jgi:hypothetical protein
LTGYSNLCRVYTSYGQDATVARAGRVREAIRMGMHFSLLMGDEVARTRRERVADEVRRTRLGKRRRRGNARNPNPNPMRPSL